MSKKPKQPDKIELLEAKLDGLVDLVEGVVKQLPATTTQPEPLVAETNTENAAVTIEPAIGVGVFADVKVEPVIAEELPFPSVWRLKIDEILGKDFEAIVEDRANGNFKIFIYLPEYLDRRLGADRGKGKDLSTGLIRRATASDDVVIWCGKIKATILKLYPDFKPNQ